MCPQDAFEGIEKRLVLGYCPKFLADNGHRSLRDITPEEWNRWILEPVHCCILPRPGGMGSAGTGAFDSHILSESSMFVYDSVLVLKTCGTIRLGSVITLLLSYLLHQHAGEKPQAAELSPASTAASETDLVCDASDPPEGIAFAFYSHLTFDRPWEQPFPHRSFEEEAAFLKEIFPSGEASQWSLSASQALNIFAFQRPPPPTLRRGPDACSFFSNEAMLFGIEEEASSDKDLLTRCFTQVYGKVARSGTPPVIEEHFFEPSGYSSNAAIGPRVYATAHVSPQPETSYASLECSGVTGGDGCDGYAADAQQWTADSAPWADCCSVLRAERAHFVHLRYRCGRALRSAPDPPPPQRISCGRADRFLHLKRRTTAAIGDVLEISCSHYEIETGAPVNILGGGGRAELEAVQDIVEGFGEPFATLLPGEGVDEDPSVSDAPEACLLRRVIESDSLFVSLPLMLVDLHKVNLQFRRWRVALPSVTPCYAVKCNSDRVLLEYLRRMGAMFDCASSCELALVRSLGVASRDVVFSHPAKNESALQNAARSDVRLTVFDNLNELYKIATHMPNAELLLRIRTDDTDAQCPLSLKYGAPSESWEELLRGAHHLGLNTVGVHFHVGSGCRTRGAFDKALSNARAVFDLAAEKFGIEMKLLDVGGGFPGELRCPLFDIMCGEIRASIESLFEPNVRLVAEPGRFFAAASHDLAVRVIAKRRPVRPSRVVPHEGGAYVEEESPVAELDEMFMYYVNDGVYGSFNSLIYDHAKVTFRLLQLRGESRPSSKGTGPHYLSTVFGQTCDGLDRIVNCVGVPELDVGDWLVFECMGAYTVSAASNFNGFQPARGVYAFMEGV